MSQKNNGRAGRLLLLDGLRLAAALAVVLYHYTAYGHTAWGEDPVRVFPGLSKFSAYGALGVHLFFIISGFVILMSAWGKPVAAFASSRIARIFPAYWAAVVLTSVLAIVVTDGSLKQLTWTDSVMNLTMLQNAVGVPNVDGVFWTLWIELLFYVTIGLFLARGLTQARVTAFILLWPLAGTLALEEGSTFWATVLVPQYSPLFAGGMALYLIYAKGHSVVQWGLVAFNAILAAHYAVDRTLPSITANTGREISESVGWMLVLGFFALCALATVTPLRFRGPAWLGTAGALTYPVYLVHEMWGWWLISLLYPVMNDWAVVACAVAFALVFAWLIHRYIEKPLGPWLRRVVATGLAHPPGKRADVAGRDERRANRFGMAAAGEAGAPFPVWPPSGAGTHENAGRN